MDGSRRSVEAKPTSRPMHADVADTMQGGEADASTAVSIRAVADRRGEREMTRLRHGGAPNLTSYAADCSANAGIVAAKTTRPAAGFGAKYAARVDEAVFIAFLMALAWTPFWFGSNRPLAWGVNAVGFGGLALFYEIGLLATFRRHPVAPRRILVPRIGFRRRLRLVAHSNRLFHPDWLSAPDLADGAGGSGSRFARLHQRQPRRHHRRSVALRHLRSDFLAGVATVPPGGARPAPGAGDRHYWRGFTQLMESSGFSCSRI